MYADNMDDAIRKNVANTVVNTVVQQLVEKKKLLAESESLPSNHYDEAVGMLHEWGIQSIKREALKKRVNHSYETSACLSLSVLLKRGGRASPLTNQRAKGLVIDRCRTTFSVQSEKEEMSEMCRKIKTQAADPRCC